LSGDEIRRWENDSIEIDRCFLGYEKLGVEEDVRSPTTPIEHAHSLGRLGYELAIEKLISCDRLGEKDLWV
jgi:hypothetical protein